MNGTQPLDRRVQRTRQLLHEALVLLASERGYEHITVGDLTERANLGRTTFYLHYRDKDHLLQETIAACLNAMQGEVQPSADERSSFATLSLRIFQHVADRRTVYRTMLTDANLASMIGVALRRYFAGVCRQLLDADAATGESAAVNTDVIAAHAAGSLFGLLNWWLEGSAVSAEELAQHYSQLMATGIPLQTTPGWMVATGNGA